MTRRGAGVGNWVIGDWELGEVVEVDDAGVVPVLVDGELVVGGAGGVFEGVVAPGAEFGVDVFAFCFGFGDFFLDEDCGEGVGDVAFAEGGEGDGGGGRRGPVTSGGGKRSMSRPCWAR